MDLLVKMMNFGWQKSAEQVETGGIDRIVK
jgi:hypothetical protein